jgi:DNA-binding response OmpR family regulator
MKRILVVGDDPELRVLGTCGFDLLTVPDGARALGWLEQESFAAVVLDSAARGVSGYDLARHVRDVSLNRETPIILVGAEADGRRRSFAAGADVFVQKPFAPATLLAMVQSIAR